jgi:hypothetical protein
LTAILLKISLAFVGRRNKAWVALGGVTINAVLAGIEASDVRAPDLAALIIFATLLLRGIYWGKPTFAPAGLFTAAILMTLTNPNILWGVGCQLRPDDLHRSLGASAL